MCAIWGAFLGVAEPFPRYKKRFGRRFSASRSDSRSLRGRVARPPVWLVSVRGCVAAKGPSLVFSKPQPALRSRRLASARVLAAVHLPGRQGRASAGLVDVRQRLRGRERDLARVLKATACAAVSAFGFGPRPRRRPSPWEAGLRVRRSGWRPSEVACPRKGSLSCSRRCSLRCDPGAGRRFAFALAFVNLAVDPLPRLCRAIMRSRIA